VHVESIKAQHIPLALLARVLGGSQLQLATGDPAEHFWSWAKETSLERGFIAIGHVDGLSLVVYAAQCVCACVCICICMHACMYLSVLCMHRQLTVVTIDHIAFRSPCMARHTCDGSCGHDGGGVDYVGRSI
jgi:hypothetical protein